MSQVALLTPALGHRVVTELAEMERIQPEWEVLLARSESDNVMLAPEWILTWWRVFGPHDGRQLRLVLFREGERLVGLAPLLRRRFWYKPGIPFRRLEFLASGEGEAHTICSDYLNVIAERGREREIAARFADVVCRNTLGRWDELVLPMMAGDNGMPDLLVEAFTGKGMHAEKLQTGQAPYIPLPGSWEEYLALLPGRHRAYVRRTLRDFEAWAGNEVEVHRAQSREELAEGKRILIELHHQRWEQSGETGVFRSPRFCAFHDSVMEQFLERDALQLMWMKVRGKPFAAIYNFAWNGKVSFYQCGRSLEVEDRIRPGVVMMTRAIQDSIKAGCREFDLLEGASTYKNQLALASRPLVRVRIARPCLVEHLRRLARRGWRWLRRKG
jgi:CelD/BcsL family acetyltransferase involved in cellulose biosynthesis